MTPSSRVREPGDDLFEELPAFDRPLFLARNADRAGTFGGRRALVETTFSKIKEIFGERLRCRTRTGRINEAQAKLTAHNIRVLVNRQLISGSP